ncbi:MAG: hypothetical protein KJI71_04030 [Patescibacteria group bacterium]|nr:hypothetical protein [Patescibacteria group bacterium]
MKKTKSLAILIIFGLVLSFPGFSFAQTENIEIPETLEEARELGEEVVGVGKKELPGVMERLWKEDVLPVWQKMYDWFYNNIWFKVANLLKLEVEKRKSIIGEELKKETQEVKEELPGVTKSLWERFKELWE